MSHNKTPGEGTMAVWAGEEEPLWEGATQVPVVHSVSFGYDDKVVCKRRRIFYRWGCSF